MKIFIFFVAALLLELIFIYPVQVYVILGFFSPIILAIIFAAFHAQKP